MADAWAETFLSQCKLISARLRRIRGAQLAGSIIAVSHSHFIVVYTDYLGAESPPAEYSVISGAILSDEKDCASHQVLRCHEIVFMRRPLDATAYLALLNQNNWRGASGNRIRHMCPRPRLAR